MRGFKSSRKRIYLDKKRQEDFQKVKDDQNEWKRISLNKKREEDFQKVKDDQNKRKKLSRNKRKIEDPKGLAKYENQVKIKRKSLGMLQTDLKNSRRQQNTMQSLFAAAATEGCSTPM